MSDRNSKLEILRGVYEDNLKTVRKEAEAPAATARRRAWRWPLLAAAALPILAALFIELAPPPASGAGERARNRVASESPTYRIDADSLQAAGADASGYNGFVADPALPLATLFDLQIKTIVIDPGHGGKDPGAVGKAGLAEKDVAFDVSRRLRQRLERHSGYRVLLTRERDVFLSLRERVDFANEHEADLFISIHLNYLPTEPASVVETFYFGAQGEKNTLQLARAENRHAGYSVADFDDMIARIENTMRLQESHRTAVSIQQSLYRNLRRINGHVTDSGVKSAPFVVLLGVEAPAVLAEISCLSNRADEAKLNTAAYREKIASFLEEGVVNYLKQRPTTDQPTAGASGYATKENQDLR